MIYLHDLPHSGTVSIMNHALKSQFSPEIEEVGAMYTPILLIIA